MVYNGPLFILDIWYLLQLLLFFSYGIFSLIFHHCNFVYSHFLEFYYFIFERESCIRKLICHMMLKSVQNDFKGENIWELLRIVWVRKKKTLKLFLQAGGRFKVCVSWNQFSKNLFCHLWEKLRSQHRWKKSAISKRKLLKLYRKGRISWASCILPVLTWSRYRVEKQKESLATDRFFFIFNKLSVEILLWYASIGFCLHVDTSK